MAKRPWRLAAAHLDRSGVAMTSPRYVVLTETDQMHLVAIRYGEGPWLRVVASFTSKERAESYADIENQFIADDDPLWVDDLKYEPPADAEPPSALARLARPQSYKWTEVSLPPIPVPPELVAALAPAENQPDADEPETDDDEQSAHDEREAETRRQWAEREATVRRMWAEGASGPEIAVAIGVSRPRFYQLKREYELPDRFPPPLQTKKKQPAPPPGIPPELDEDEGEEIEVSVPPPPAPPAIHTGESLTRAGVTVTTREGNEKIARNGETVPLTINQARFCALLLPAAPAPVGLEWMRQKFGLTKAEARMCFPSIARTLNGGILAPLGLSIEETKGIGYGLKGVDMP